MAQLSPHATTDEIRCAYLENASYREDNSQTKAKRFITAITMILFDRPDALSVDGRSVSPASLEKALERAERWLSMNPTTPPGGAASGERAIYLDTSGIRD